MSAPRFACPGCSAGMEFDPQTGSLRCPYCGAATTIPDDPSADPVEELSYEEFTAKASNAQLSRMSENSIEITCGNCGASVEFVPPQVAGICPFCASRIVAQPRSSDPLIAPQAVLPFALTKQQATANLRRWLATRWFAPGDLQKVARPDRLEGMYLPFWTFDANSTTDYVGQRGEHYWVTETYTAMENGRPVTRTRQVRRTHWYPAAGRVNNPFDDLLIPASKSIDQKRLDDLEPWDLGALEPYEPQFLAGFKAQRYQVELPEGFQEARKRMEPAIRSSIRRDIGGDEQRIWRTSTSIFDVTFKHLLLPAWIGAFRYRSKVYQLAINARTGEVCAERPYSALKIALLVLAIALVTALVAIVAGGR